MGNSPGIRGRLLFGLNPGYNTAGKTVGKGEGYVGSTVGYVGWDADCF